LQETGTAGETDLADTLADGPSIAAPEAKRVPLPRARPDGGARGIPSARAQAAQRFRTGVRIRS